MDTMCSAWEGARRREAFDRDRRAGSDARENGAAGCETDLVLRLFAYQQRGATEDRGRQLSGEAWH